MDALPAHLSELVAEVPVIVLDEPTEAMLRELGYNPRDAAAAEELCGLHSGHANTERSVEHSGELPTQIHLFRRGIVALAGGWDQPNADDEVYEQIMITLLHEIGHQFGLSEDDLTDLGYD